MWNPQLELYFFFTIMPFGEQNTRALNRLLDELSRSRGYNEEQIQEFRLNLIPLVRMLFQSNAEAAQQSEKYAEEVEKKTSRLLRLKYLLNGYNEEVHKVQKEVANIMQAFSQRINSLNKIIVNCICDLNRSIKEGWEGDVAGTEKLIFEEGFEINNFSAEMLPQWKSTVENVDKLTYSMLSWVFELSKSKARLINGCKGEMNNFASFKEQSEGEHFSAENIRIFSSIELEGQVENRELEQVLFKSGLLVKLDSQAVQYQRRKPNLGIFQAFDMI